MDIQGYRVQGKRTQNMLHVAQVPVSLLARRLQGAGHHQPRRPDRGPQQARPHRSRDGGRPGGALHPQVCPDSGPGVRDSGEAEGDSRHEGYPRPAGLQRGAACLSLCSGSQRKEGCSFNGSNHINFLSISVVSKSH